MRLVSLFAALSFSLGLVDPGLGRDILREDFDTVAAGRLPDGWKALDGEWEVAGGELVGKNLTGDARLLVPGGPWRDLQVELTVKFLGARKPGSWLSVNFGVVGQGKARDSAAGKPIFCHSLVARQNAAAKNGVEYAVRHGTLTEPGARRVRGTGSGRSAFEPGQRHRLRLQASGGRVRFEIDGQLVLDSALGCDVEAGTIGLGLFSAQVAFDELEISRLSEEDRAELRVEYGPLRSVPVVAHRGASADAPENTLAALRLGTARGAAASEFDVYKTRDGAIVLLHDRDLLRTTNFRSVFPDRKDARVEALDLEEIRKLDAGSWKSSRYQGEPVPTLEEALQALHGLSMPVVEIKPADIGADVARVVRRLRLADRVFVQSFSDRAIREFRRELPQTTTGFLTGERVSVDGLERARVHLRKAREAGANAVVCHYSLVGPRYIREAHRRAMIVWVYTVDDPTLWGPLVRLGVDGIITNVPGRLVEFLDRAVRTE